MVIAKTASRNVALKVARMRDAIMQDQDEFIIRDTVIRISKTSLWLLTTGLIWRM